MSSQTNYWVLCELCQLWRVCTFDYYLSIDEESDLWFCSYHPDLADCDSEKRKDDIFENPNPTPEKKVAPSEKEVCSWFAKFCMYLQLKKTNSVTVF